MKSKAELHQLTVEYTETPLGIDVSNPRFAWQMTAPAHSRGYHQTAYQIIVDDAEGSRVWDSGKVESGISVGILYEGEALQPTTRYMWTVTVWDQEGAAVSASSWFETGLMDPSYQAWDGAVWIGGSDEDLPLNSHVLSVFRIQYQQQLLEGSSKASFIFGANDARLLNRNMNIYNLESKVNESYIKLELDISALDSGGQAKLHVYRAGFAPGDDPSRPFASFPIAKQLINDENKYAAHSIEIEGLTGLISIYINGRDNCLAKDFQINPIGRGYDYITFPMLADIGFAAEPGQKALFSKLTIRNYRSPYAILFQEDLNGTNYSGIFADSDLKIKNGCYFVDGGSTGIFATADPSRNSMPMLRTEFTASPQEIDRARLYVTARGVYEIYLNGSLVGDYYFTPDFTQYDVTHMYQTYDVTDLLNPEGKNALGALLGEGWWSGYLSYTSSNWNYFGDRQSLLAKLVIRYKDGKEEIITTNPETWKYYHDGPIIYSSFFQGENYDARKEAAVFGWDTPNFDDAGWKPAVEVPLEGTAFLGKITTEYSGEFEFNYENLKLVGQIGASPQVYKTLTAVKLHEPRPGVYVYDMGQNMVGIPRITIPNGTAGAVVTLRYGEMLYPDLPQSGANVGMVMMENYRAAHSHDTYIRKGGSEVIQPHFTFHGYRYIEITGIDKPLPLEAVQGLVITSITELTAEYRTSNELVNRLWQNIVWSKLGNFLSIPTDCPQRNERMGWSGDISVFSRTAVYLSNTAGFLARHMMNMRDTQAASGRFGDTAPMYGEGFGGLLWGSAGIVIPWEVYLQYGDRRILEDNYQAMKSYLHHLDAATDENGLITDSRLGDWLGPENSKNENHFLVTAYHVYDLGIMAQIAAILGRKEDAAEFQHKYQQRKAFFNKHFVNEDYRTTRFDGKTLIDTQSSYAVGLALGVFSDDALPYARKYLLEAVARENVDDEGELRPPYTLMTGFIGTAWISTALSESGWDEAAYRLLQQTEYPSWLYPVIHGATTIWERLDGFTEEKGFAGHNWMNSFNHYSFGAVGQWLMSHSLGIQRDPDNPGFKHFILQPTPDPDRRMTFAEGSYDSVYGRIKSAWKYENDSLILEVEVPANTTATIYIPAADPNSIREQDQAAALSAGVEFIEYKNKKAVYRLQAGSYRFTAPLS